jgi:hypothetical protein
MIGLKTILRSERTQKVVLDGYTSTYKGTEADVSEGSVLGPFLFSLYINDINSDLVNQMTFCW